MEQSLRFQKITTADNRLYAFMETLMKQSFPVDEYRDLAELRRFADTNPLFTVTVIFDGKEAVGFIGYWQLDDFVYIEHFAINPSMRNRNYGSRSLRQFCTEAKRPVVLEVELPETELAKRRIGFYERNGFILWPDRYIQPAYKPESASLEMRIMAYGAMQASDFGRVRDLLYTNVYGVTPAGD